MPSSCVGATTCGAQTAPSFARAPRYRPSRRPEPYDGDAVARAWSAHADLVVFPQSTKGPDWVPSYEDFCAALAKAKGAAGFDGWSARELKCIGEYFSPLLREVYHVLRDTACLLADSPEAAAGLQSLFSWRVVGVPKRAADQSRPIGVESALLRVWLSAAAQSVPQPSGTQWACKREISVIHAVADWLAQCDHAVEGAEMDLSKAYDMLGHEVVAAALEREGVSRRTLAVCRAAWRGPRICMVEGELAASAVEATRGLPQGDSIAPGGMCAALVPWAPPSAHAWCYMDDRSLTSTVLGGVDEAIAYTAVFDAAAGAVENAAKRQRWRRGDRTRIEHIGLSVVPDDPYAEILPRDGWEKLAATVRRVGTLPRAMHVRERLIAGFAKPLWCWAAPFLAAPPQETAHSIRRAILRTACTWWCKGRWWATRIQLHPTTSRVLSTARALRSPHFTWSLFAEVAVQRVFATVGISAERHAGTESLLLGVLPADDPRVREAARSAAATQGHGLGPYRFLLDSEAAAHALRVILRVRLLLKASPRRFDSEGIDDVDVEAASYPLYRRWVASLSTPQRSYRGGAARSPTRGGRYVPGRPCPGCGEILHPSLRHLWADCPKYAELRDSIGAAHLVPTTWWAAQPRVTAKSGWVCLRAAANPRTRGEMLIATCKLGVNILTDALA